MQMSDLSPPPVTASGQWLTEILSLTYQDTYSYKAASAKTLTSLSLTTLTKSSSSSTTFPSIPTNVKNQGSMFTNANETNFDNGIRATFPAITPSALATIQSFYPAQNYPSVFRRLAAAIGDVKFDCNTFAMASSSAPAKRYRFLTSMPPGIHGTGTLALFEFPFATPELVKRFQRLAMNFVVFGDPNGWDGGVGGGVVFPESKGAEKGVEINATDIKVADFSADSEVCTWWAKGLYTP